MAGDIKALRTRIKSVNSTLHLTKAMGLVASSKIRRALKTMKRSGSYSGQLQQTVNLLMTSPECKKSPYMQIRNTNKTRIIIVAGDRGLAGGYNGNIFRLARTFDNADFIPVGKRACDRYAGKLYMAESFSYDDAYELSKKLCNDFANAEFDKLGIISTQYVSSMSQEAKVTWVLPLSAEKNKKTTDIVFEPDELTVLNTVIYEYIAALIYASVKEGFASEVAARRVAMDSAGKNAQQMIDDLSLQYNRARQGAITQEITEIVAGSGV